MNSIKSCFSTILVILALLAVFFGEDVWDKGWIYWNSNWTLKEDYDFENDFPRPRTDIVVDDYLPGGHYYGAEDWSDPRVRDEADVTFNQLVEKAGLLENLKLRPWREATKRNGRYDLRRQVQLFVQIDQGLTAADQSGRKFELFATLTVIGGAVAAGAKSEAPGQTAYSVSRIGTGLVPSITDFWRNKKARYEMEKLTRSVFRPRAYGRELDPSHPLTVFLKSFDK